MHTSYYCTQRRRRILFSIRVVHGERRTTRTPRVCIHHFLRKTPPIPQRLARDPGIQTPSLVQDEHLPKARGGASPRRRFTRGRHQPR